MRLGTPQNIPEVNRLEVDFRFDSGSRFARNGALSLLSDNRKVASIRGTTEGLIESALLADGVRSFYALPFAAPPVASLRFRAPQLAAGRSSALTAQSLGPSCLQPSGQNLFTVGGAPSRQSEDCLQLNIWQPEAPDSATLKPVMVWIHGGGLSIGSAVELTGSRLTYDGAGLAKKDVVVVSFNYRLGAFGYSAMSPFVAQASDHPSAGNYGLLDQIAALRWIRNNIAQFGGDPNQITIFGESAGAVSVCALMSSPEARGLFARAISQSGNCLLAPTAFEKALAQGDRVIANAGCAAAGDVANCMRALSAQALLEASRSVVNLSGTASGESYGLTIDGFSLKEAPAVAISSGRAAQIPLLIGVNDDESTSTNPASGLPGTVAGYENLVRTHSPLIAEQILQQYPASSYATPQKAYQDLIDDLRFTCANRRAAFDHAARGNAVYHYALTEILPDPPLAPLESFHGQDIVFLFERPAALAAELNLRAKMQAAWVTFARTSAPGNTLGYPWPRYDSNRLSAELNSSATQAIGDYRKSYCEFWTRFIAL